MNILIIKFPGDKLILWVSISHNTSIGKALKLTVCSEPRVFSRPQWKRNSANSYSRPGGSAPPLIAKSKQELIAIKHLYRSSVKLLTTPCNKYVVHKNRPSESVGLAIVRFLKEELAYLWMIARTEEYKTHFWFSLKITFKINEAVPFIFNN